MLHAYPVAQIRAVEAAHPAFASGGLMRRAAAGLATAVIDYLGGAYGKRVIALIGPGNNGADTLYAGAHLARRGARVEAWCLGETTHAQALAAFRGAGGRVAKPRPVAPDGADVVLDGVLGIGGRPGLPAHVVEAVMPIAASIPLIAVDLPSGLDADSGEVAGMVLRADLTVTFGSYKAAHLVEPAASQCGEVKLIDLGLDFGRQHHEYRTSEVLNAHLAALEAADVTTLLRAPAHQGHKYSRGVVGVRAGSATYPGAALLAVAGANTGLAGMVRYVGSAAPQVATAHPETVGAGRVQAWVVGPGTAEDAAAHLAAAAADDVPLVVDADAIAHLRAHRRPDQAAKRWVITPHAGELAALLGVERAEVEARQLYFARRAAEELSVVVLLKGPRTVIAQPDGPTRINTTGTPWLATAGAGDVLAGATGSLIAAGLSPFEAASVGAWLHGRAAADVSGGGPVTASMVASGLATVVRDLSA